MADAPLPLDSWPAIIVGVSAAAAALIVPLNTFVKTLLDYRVETRKAEAMVPDTARNMTGCGGALFDSMAVADLTAAIKGLTSAITADTKSDEAWHATQLGSTMARLTEVLDRMDAGRGPGRR